MTTETEPQHTIYKSIRECNYDSDQINLPKSEEFFDFNDLYRLHVRTLWPDQPPKAVIMYIHGYVSHINRPTVAYLGPLCKSNGYACVAFDFPGHGYSEGERAMVNSVEEVVDCALHALSVFYHESSSSEHHLIHRPYPLDPATPLLLFGHSMGGSISLLLAEHLKRLSYNFLGSVLLCPAIKIPSLPPVLRFLLDYMIAPVIPTVEIPDWMNKEFNPKNTWNDDDYIKYVKADHYPQNPKGLGWGGKIRFGSASTLLHLAEVVQSKVPAIDHPFLLFFDPEDKTVNFAGGEFLMERSSTPKQDKELVILEGGGHDLLINRLGIISRRALAWIDNRVATYTIQAQTKK